ncbi:hypothetical protein BST61_g8023 [Cercospora zeina]
MQHSTAQSRSKASASKDQARHQAHHQEEEKKKKKKKKKKKEKKNAAPARPSNKPGLARHTAANTACSGRSHHAERLAQYIVCIACIRDR